ncbi:Lrp/AsnC family transcriptional regulator [Rossellomorea sp. y25]|uniref:Lrp/AsnC family transcriptional regulator n=1 Tax=Rossellomorea sp. y25 TaxID=3118174 RepID=UPI00260D3139|nr:Lrp/AsnC family transcriptional regulator [uncultured Rossellomorea sp.]
MLDATDKRILEELSKNGRITMKELGAKVHLTGQAASTRVLKLEEEGIIEGYTIKVNDRKTGYSVHAYINIYTKSLHHEPYLTSLDKFPQYVIHNYKISGEGCYLLECKFPSHDELDDFITRLTEYANYKLSIVINKH